MHGRQVKKRGKSESDIKRKSIKGTKLQADDRESTKGNTIWKTLKGHKKEKNTRKEIIGRP